MTSDCLPHQVKHEILFDEVLMPWLLEWLMICSQVHACAQHGAQHGTQPLCAAATECPCSCSQCNHHGVRHTAVEFAMAAFERLAHIAKELRSARQNAERLSSGKRRKDAMGQVRAQHGASRCMLVHAKCSPRRMRM